MDNDEKKVFVTVKSITRPLQEEPYNQVQKTWGVLRKIESGFEIEYSTPPEDEQNLKTLITCKGEDYVTVLREGDLSSTVILERNKKSNSRIATPFGSLFIGAYPEQIDNNMTENGGTLHFKYTLDFNSALALRNDVTVTVKETM